MREHAVCWVHRRIRMLTHGGSDTLNLKFLLNELSVRCTSVPSCKFIKEFITWRGRPRPRRTPWSGCAKRRETEADEGVGRGPEGPPYIADFCSEILTQDTSVRGNSRSLTVAVL